MTWRKPRSHQYSSQWWGIEGAKCDSKGAKWLILAIFFFWLEGGQVGAEPLTGAISPHAPLDAALCIVNRFQNYWKGCSQSTVWVLNKCWSIIKRTIWFWLISLHFHNFTLCSGLYLKKVWMIGCATGIIFIDLKKAFDTVNHDILINKLF